MSYKLPITAIIAFRNEKDLLQNCLCRLYFCSQIILIDMQSTDGSRQIAQRFSKEIYDWPADPIADPARAWAMQFAKHPWLLMVDPDEHYPAFLIPDIAKALEEHPDAGGFRLPWRFYFKHKQLTGTIWGGSHLSKLVMVHRERGRFLPWCNRISEVLPGHPEITIANTDANHIRHYWSNSYKDLWTKHVQRYPAKDAVRLHADGVKYRPAHLWKEPIKKFWESFKHRDGWRLGFRGLALSFIFGLYHALIAWHLQRVKTPPPAPPLATTMTSPQPSRKAA